MPNIREGLSESADFERPFRDKLTNLEGMPPQDSWQAIQHVLDRDRNHNRRWYLPLVLLLLVGGGGFISGYLVSQRQMAYEREAEAMETELHNITASEREQTNTVCAECAADEPCSDACTDQTLYTDPGMAVNADRASAASFAQEMSRELLYLGDDVRESPTGSSDDLLSENGQVSEHKEMTVAVTDSVEKISEVFQKQVAESTDSSANDKRESVYGKWALQLTVGGSYTFKKITPVEDLFYLTTLTNKNRFSWNNGGYQVAARVRRELNSRTTLSAGLSWSRWQTDMAYDYYEVLADSTIVQQINARSIEVNTYFSTRNNEIRTTLHQVGLNAGLLRKIRVLRSEHTVLLEAGLYQKIYSSTQSNQSGHRVSVRPTLFSVKAGVEKTVEVGKLQFTVTPYVQRYLGSLYTGGSVFRMNPIQFGLDVGVLLPLGN